jgi:copper(I)-binding protein
VTAGLAVAAIAFSAAACGDDDDDDDGADATQTMEATSPAEDGAEPVTAGDLTITNVSARGAIDRGAVFFTVTNEGSADDAIIGAETEAAEKAELHETVTEGASTMMQPVDKIDVPSGGEAILEQGGLHVMLIDPTMELAVGEVIGLTIIFENAGPVDLEAEIMSYSDEPMPSMEGGMDGETEGGMDGSPAPMQ